MLLMQDKRISSRFARNFMDDAPSFLMGVSVGHPSLAVLGSTQSGKRLEITERVGRELSNLQSRLDQVYRLAWLAGDEVTIERLRRYAIELEARSHSDDQHCLQRG